MLTKNEKCPNKNYRQLIIQPFYFMYSCFEKYETYMTLPNANGQLVIPPSENDR